MTGRLGILLTLCTIGAARAATGPTGRRTTGDCPVIFLRVEFPGRDKMQEDLSYFHEPRKRTGLVDRMVAYYEEASGGKFRIRPIVSDRVYLANNIRAYYRTRAKDLVAQTIAKANMPAPLGEGERLDFSKASTVVVFFAGTGVESDAKRDSPLDLWSHFFVTEPYVCRTDGVEIKDAILIAEHESNEQDPSIEFSPFGVLCHEFGHYLGLPDLYPPDGSHEGAGSWGLMSHGAWIDGGKTPAHPCAWSKIALGWIGPMLLMSDQVRVSLEAVQTNPQVIKIWARDSASPHEYFLIANRQRVGFDRKLPGAGLLIWHIDESVMGFRTCNSNVAHKRVDLEAADGLPCDLDRPRARGGNRGDAGDPWAAAPLGFTPHSSPNTKPYSGEPGRFAITNISPSGLHMTFDVSFVGGTETGQRRELTPREALSLRRGSGREPAEKEAQPRRVRRK